MNNNRINIWPCIIATISLILITHFLPYLDQIRINYGYNRKDPLVCIAHADEHPHNIQFRINRGRSLKYRTMTSDSSIDIIRTSLFSMTGLEVNNDKSIDIAIEYEEDFSEYDGVTVISEDSGTRILVTLMPGGESIVKENDVIDLDLLFPPIIPSDAIYRGRTWSDTQIDIVPEKGVIDIKRNYRIVDISTLTLIGKKIPAVQIQFEEISKILSESADIPEITFINRGVVFISLTSGHMSGLHGVVLKGEITRITIEPGLTTHQDAKIIELLSYSYAKTHEDTSFGDDDDSSRDKKGKIKNRRISK